MSLSYEQYRSYGHTWFTAWSLSKPWWCHFVALPLAFNAVGWGAAYCMWWL